MECLESKGAIVESFEYVRNLRYTERTDNLVQSEEEINAFLDAILDFKKSIVSKTEQIEVLVDKLESITWFDNVDDECLMILSDIISLSKDLSQNLERKYKMVGLTKIKAKGIAKNEIKNYIASIEDLKEVADDLEDVFFKLPHCEEFNSVTVEFSKLT